MLSVVMMHSKLLAATPEEIAYQAAYAAFSDGLNERAEKELADFIKRFPTSERLSEAILMQAQARFRLGQYDALISLLNANITNAGKNADKYRFWIGEAHFQSANYAAAANSYSQLLKDYQGTFLKSQAAYMEALSWYRLGNLTNAISLLSQTNSAFQQAANVQPNDEFVIQGQLLLGEIYMIQKKYDQADQSIQALKGRKLTPQLAWKKEYLNTRFLLAKNQVEQALAGITNLLESARSTGSPSVQADSTLLRGEVLKAANRFPEAVSVYEENLELYPSVQKREILLQAASLNRKLGNFEKAIRHLQTLLLLNPRDPEADTYKLSLGELHLAIFKMAKDSAINNQTTNTSVSTNLVLAINQFDQIITNAPKGQLLGLVHLNRGWCFWESQQWQPGLAAFKLAIENLPVSTNQMLARLKIADILFELKDYPAAITNYQEIVTARQKVPEFPDVYVQNALYQLLRAQVETLQPVPAANTLQTLLTNYPTASCIDRGLLLVAQAFIRSNQLDESRRFLQSLIEKLPQSSLVPEAKLVLARTYVLQKQWELAIQSYDQWVKIYTNNPKLPQVEFDRAWVRDQAGQATNALSFFTGFLERFPTHPNAPLAQFWIGNYYFNQNQFVDAEKNYQLLFRSTNWNPGVLGYQARLAAGRAAYARQGYNEARDYFQALIQFLLRDTNSPPSLLWEGYIALGDSLLLIKSPGETNVLTKFGEAINAFAKVPENDPLAPLAWGRIANCHSQMGLQDPTRYISATNFYWKIIQSTNANIEARSNAEVGLGIVREKMANAQSPTQAEENMKAALDHYRNVIYTANLRPNEKPSAFWIARAGQEAARLLENQNRWNDLVTLYQRLITLLPDSMRPLFEKKLELVKKKLPQL